MALPSSPDFSIVHPVPGWGKPLDYTPTKKDPLYVGEPFPTPLLTPCITSTPYGCEPEDGPRAVLPITTLREFLMLGCMNSVTDKPDWDKKVFDHEIIEKWRSETVEAEGVDMTDAMFDFCIAELQHVARNVYPRRADRALVVFNGNVVKSDHAVPESVKIDLQQAVQPLEDVPDSHKDWHPGSNDTVLDLVHPSLFPFIAGKTRILKLKQKVVELEDCVERCGEGERVMPHRGDAIPKANEKRGAQPYSLEFQWLPCEVDISGNGPKIISYINNLHPRKHTDLYRVIEQVIGAALPLWEITLAPLRDREFSSFKRIVCDTVVYQGDENEGGNENTSEADSIGESNDRVDENSGSDGAKAEAEVDSEVEGRTEARSNDSRSLDTVDGDAEVVEDDGDDNWDTDEEEGGDEGDDSSVLKGSEGRSDSSDANDSEDEVVEDDGDDSDSDEDPRHVVIQPEPERFDPKKYDKQPKPFSFKELYGKRGQPLQIIVKLANIELTPEKPKYEGGTWHVEGKQNEHICATAIYYYSSQNIKGSRLAFRQFVDAGEVEEFPYEQNHHEFLEDLFGCKNHDGGVQDVGKVETKEGRLLTFPNILQHQVQPFELEDPTKNGHRKILALFLVDPNVRIISTAYVPPQQADWWQELVKSMCSTDQGLGKLPEELKDAVFEAVDGFPIALTEAKEYRKELMKERKKFVRDHQRTVEEFNSFSLCEH